MYRAVPQMESRLPLPPPPSMNNTPGTCCQGERAITKEELGTLDSNRDDGHSEQSRGDGISGHGAGGDS